MPGRPATWLENGIEIRGGLGGFLLGKSPPSRADVLSLSVCATSAAVPDELQRLSVRTPGAEPNGCTRLRRCRVPAPLPMASSRWQPPRQRWGSPPPSLCPAFWGEAAVAWEGSRQQGSPTASACTVA